MNSSPSFDKALTGAQDGALRVMAFKTPAEDFQETLFPSSHDVFVETRGDEPSGRHRPPAGDAVFHASLLTATCYRFPVAEMASRFLVEKLGLDHEFAQLLHTALQELLMNAVVHGNLEIAERFESSESFDRYCGLVQTRLADPRLAARRITISATRTPKALTLRIAQEGAPFLWDKVANELLYQGRGIALVRACGGMLEAGDGEHEVSVTFRLEGDAPAKVSEITSDELKALQRARILLVDDAEFNVVMLEEVLGSRGFRNCLKAFDGEMALEITLAHKPDIVILDLMMPGMNGYEYCERIRKIPEFSDIPILVLTMLKEPGDRARAFEAGASDLVSKPVHVDELLARVTLHLQRKFNMGKLSRYHDENEQELQAARKMQDMLLPGPAAIREAEQLHHLTIFSHSAPCAKIGGDFWGMLEVSPRELALFMVDFSGHGVTAALNTFRLHAIIMELKQCMGDPGLFLTTLNERLFALLGPEQFATMFCGVLDSGADMLRYAAAGSPSPLIISAGGASAHTLDCRGFPLGVLKSARYPTHEAPLMRGDSLLLYSDALLEGVNKHFQAFEESFFSAYSWPNKEPEKLFQSLIEDFYRHTGGVVADDLTVNLYFRNP